MSTTETPPGLALDRAIEDVIFDGLQSTALSMPAYSASISAAWRVVEQLAPRGWRLNLDHGVNGGWQARFDHSARTAQPPHVSSNAATAPAAICRAALAVVALEAHSGQQEMTR